MVILIRLNNDIAILMDSEKLKNMTEIYDSNDGYQDTHNQSHYEQNDLEPKDDVNNGIVHVRDFKITF